MLSAAGLALGLALTPATIFADQKAGGDAKPKPAPAAAQAAPKADAKPWSVRMSKVAPHTFTVKAKDAALSEITGELSRLLKVPFTLTPLMGKQKVTLEFGGLNLEATLRMLAPQSYVDYVAGGQGDEPKALAVYLQGLNEPVPSMNAAVRGSSEAILIEGDTEEGTNTDEQKKKEEETRPTTRLAEAARRRRQQQ